MILLIICYNDRKLWQTSFSSEFVNGQYLVLTGTIFKPLKNIQLPRINLLNSYNFHDDLPFKQIFSHVLNRFQSN